MSFHGLKKQESACKRGVTAEVAMALSIPLSFSFLMPILGPKSHEEDHLAKQAMQLRGFLGAFGGSRPRNCF